METNQKDIFIENHSAFIDEYVALEFQYNENLDLIQKLRNSFVPCDVQIDDNNMSLVDKLKGSVNVLKDYQNDQLNEVIDHLNAATEKLEQNRKANDDIHKKIKSLNFINAQLLKSLQETITEYFPQLRNVVKIEINNAFEIHNQNTTMNDIVMDRLKPVYSYTIMNPINKYITSKTKLVAYLSIENKKTDNTFKRHDLFNLIQDNCDFTLDRNLIGTVDVKPLIIDKFDDSSLGLLLKILSGIKKQS